MEKSFTTFRIEDESHAYMIVGCFQSSLRFSDPSESHLFTID
jgi:hypothetical protein